MTKIPLPFIATSRSHLLPFLTDAFHIDFWNSLLFSCPQPLGNIATLAPTLLDAFFCVNSGYRWSHHVTLDNIYWFSKTPWWNPRSTVSGIYFTHSYADVIRHQAISNQYYTAIDFRWAMLLTITEHVGLIPIFPAPVFSKPLDIKLSCRDRSQGPSSPRKVQFHRTNNQDISII